MNQSIELIKNHRSIRDFKDEAVSDEMIDAIIEASQSMPNSINGQQTSVIVIRDNEKKARVAELTGGQPWIAKAPVFLLFVADFYKTDLAARKNGLEQQIHESVEGTLVGAVDVGLNLGAAIIAAESLGLGIVPIGAVRRSPEDIIELFGLPEKVFPVAGLVIGHPNSLSRKKPRLPLSTFRHDEVYQRDGMEEAIHRYDEHMAEYLIEVGRENEENWSKRTSSVYQHIYFPQVHPVMEKQGYKNNK